jgi:hypothetical protein
LANRTPGSIACAAFLNSGAIILQGPHHSAQKSTTTGMELRVTCFTRAAPSSSAGCPVKSGARHLPQRAASAGFSGGNRFTAEQEGQTISFMMTFPGLPLSGEWAA